MADGKRGRPSTFTDEKAAEILERITRGTPPHTAAGACGVDGHTFQRWLDSNAEFSQSVTRARSEFEARAVESITQAGSEDWRALAWSLERQMQAKYALKIRVVREDEANKLLDVAERVLAREDFVRLVEALAAEDSASATGEASGGEPDRVEH